MRLQSTEGGSVNRLPYVWDYDIDEERFRALLEGRETLGRLDRAWAAVRLLEHATYPEILQMMSFRELIAGWPQWRGRLRSQSRRRAFDFLVDWLPRHHPELV
jgi:hypothetical protein